MVLTYNQSNHSFILTSNDEEKAEAAGLTLSSRVRGPNGEKVWYTGDHNKQPTYNPYAVLVFWDEADELAREQLANFKADYDKSWATDSEQNFPIRNGHSYLPYQRGGIEYSLSRGNTILGDDMGLGKTLQAIGISNAIGAKKNLVICPASVRLNWQREVRKFSTIPNVRTFAILNSAAVKFGINPDQHYIITSYDLLTNATVFEHLCAEQWDHLILDEVHFTKSHEAKRTKAIFGSPRYKKRDFLAKHASRITGLTGTLHPNRPRESYTIIRGLNWEAIDFMSYDEFCMRFNPSMRLETGHVLEKTHRLWELQARLRCNLMVRRLKDDVRKDLPDKRYEMTYVEENGAIRAVLAKERLIDFDPKMLYRPDFQVEGQISTVRREMGEAKVSRVIEHVKYVLDVLEVPKIVLFAHHRTVMDALFAALQPYGVVEVRGGVSPKKKQEAIDKFKDNSQVRIFSGQIDAAGVGIDGLQNVANLAVFAEPAWVPGANQQCIDRLHRHGQNNNVIAQFLIAEGSLDEKILEAVLYKAKDIHQSLDGGYEKLTSLRA